MAKFGVFADGVSSERGYFSPKKQSLIGQNQSSIQVIAWVHADHSICWGYGDYNYVSY